MTTPAPSPPLLSRAARALWWCGMPLLLLASIVFAREFPPLDGLYTVANALSTVSPLAAELVAEYPLWWLAMLLLTGMTLWSHHRRTAAVRLESLALPTCIAGLEACERLSWFLTCRGGIVISPPALHAELHVAATASLVAMAAPLFAGAILTAKCPKGFSGSLSRRWLSSVAAAIASIALLWFAYDVILRGYLAPGAP